MYKSRVNDAQMLPLLYLALLAAGLFSLLFTTLFVRPKPLPPSTAWTGCYTAPGAPPIRFDGSRVHIAQPGIPPIGYRFAHRKYGTLEIETTAPLRLDRLASSALAFASTPGGGTLSMRPAHRQDGQVYDVFKTEDAQFLEIYAGDSSTVEFTSAAPASCG